MQASTKQFNVIKFITMAAVLAFIAFVTLAGQPGLLNALF
jgi:hypothetical protein